MTTASSTENSRGNVLPYFHIQMLTSKRRLPAPLSGLESAAASRGILDLKLCGMVLRELPFK
jgi:hypothetical protein